MAKIINQLLLLVALTWSTNGYSWSCYFSQTSDGWYQDGSMVCDGIDEQVALEQEYCGWFRPQDPVCSSFLQTVCIDTVEYKTESCPVNYSGGLQYSRSYVCQSQTWSDWTLTSNNCSPDPPSCIETSDSRTLACPSGYEGQITETNITSCPDPYGNPISSGWIEEQNSCVQSQTDPVSPVSVTSPSNPVNNMITESVTAPPIDATQTNDIPVVPSTGGQPVESQIQEQLEESVEESSNSSSSNSTDSVSKVENKEDKKNDGEKKDTPNNSKEHQEPINELVHGFGLVLSMDILQKPMEFYQPPLNDMFSITQEFPLETRLIEEFYSDVLGQNYLEDYYIGNSNSTWERLRRSDILQ